MCSYQIGQLEVDITDTSDLSNLYGGRGGVEVGTSSSSLTLSLFSNVDTYIRRLFICKIILVHLLLL